MARKVSLQAIADKAVKDSGFLRALKKDPYTALANANLALSKADLLLVKRFVKGGAIRVKPDIERILRAPRLACTCLVLFPWLGRKIAGKIR